MGLEDSSTKEMGDNGWSSKASFVFLENIEHQYEN